LLGLAKSQIEAAYAVGVNNANLGNFLTNKYSFLATKARNFGNSEGPISAEIERRFADDIDHVHHKLEADIRANQIDEPTDQQTFNDVVLWPLVREELEQIAPPEVVIALDLRA
jgi:hypothetical protein